MKSQTKKSIKTKWCLPIILSSLQNNFLNGMAVVSY